MRPSQIRDKALEMGVNVHAAFQMRKRYLLGLIDRWELFIDEQTAIMPESTEADAIDEIIALRRYEHVSEKGRLKKDAITDEMIERAREYPIDKLIEFNRGVALAWCHNDTRPSLSWWKAGNRATCFPCGRTFSALDCLMERDGMSFVDAVKQLQ